MYFKRCALNQADSASSLWPPLLHGLSAEYFVVFSVQCPISSLLLLCCVLCGAFSILCCACLCSLLCAPQAELLSQHAAAALVSCQSVALLPSRFTLSSAALGEVQNWWEGSDWDSTALHQGKAVTFYLQQVIPSSDMDNVCNKCNFGLTDWGRFLMQKLMVSFGYSSCAQFFLLLRNPLTN